MNVGNLLGRLTPFSNSKQMLIENQNTTDIIKQIIETHKVYKSDYDKISNDFWKGSVKKTCKYLFDFLKSNVKYSIEPDSRQSVKSPAAILSTGKFAAGGNDCKHYSLFQAGILDSLKRKGYNIDWCYRFANYKLFSTLPHHVFVVVKINGVEYWCDPVLSEWNLKKPYINKIDKKMSLYSISGIGARQKKRGRLAAKIALSVPRRAFLALVRLNVRKFALKLNNTLQSSRRQELLTKWNNLGGNSDLLISTVRKAVAKYKRKHPKVKMYRGRAIGDPAAAAILASAAPIILALLKFLGGKSQEIDDSIPEQQDQTDQTETAQDETAQVGSINPYLLYGGIALAGYYLFTNKRLFK